MSTYDCTATTDLWFNLNWRELHKYRAESLQDLATGLFMSSPCPKCNLSTMEDFGKYNDCKLHERTSSPNFSTMGTASHE